MREEVRLHVYLATFFCLLYLLTANGRLVNRDAEAVFQVARSLVEHGSFAVPAASVFTQAEGPRGTAGDSLSFATETARVGLDGRVYAMYGIGESLAAVPLYMAGKALQPFLQVDPGISTRLAVSLLNSLVTALTVLLLYAWSRRLGYATGVALFVAFGYGLASMAWPYAKSFAGEPLTGALLLLGFYALERAVSPVGRRGDPTLESLEPGESAPSGREGRWLLLSGAAYGAALLVRISAGIALPVAGLYLLWRLVDSRRRLAGQGGTWPMGDARYRPPLARAVLRSIDWASRCVGARLIAPLRRDRSINAPANRSSAPPVRGGGGRPPREPHSGAAGRGAIFGQLLRSYVRPGGAYRAVWAAVLLWAAPVAAALLTIGLYDAVRFGSPLTTGYQSIAWNVPPQVGLYGLLLSPGKSLFLYNPLLLAALVGLALMLWRRRPVACYIVALAAVWVGFHSPYRFWEGGWSWGPRLLLPIVPLLLLPLGELVSHPAADRTPAGRAIPVPLALVAAGARRLVPLLFVLGLLLQVTAVTADYTRYLWGVSVAHPEDAYERLIYEPAGSPLLWQAVAAVEVIGNVARPGGLAELRADVLDRARRHVQAGLDGNARSVAVLDDSMVVGLNIPDFWFVLLPLFGAPAVPVAGTAAGLLLLLVAAAIGLRRAAQSVREVASAPVEATA